MFRMLQGKKTAKRGRDSKAPRDKEEPEAKKPRTEEGEAAQGGGGDTTSQQRGMLLIAKIAARSDDPEVRAGAKRDVAKI